MFDTFTLWTFVKFSLAILIGGYSIFTIVLITQVRTMNRIIQQSFASLLMVFIALFLFVASVVLLIATLVFL